MNFDKFIEKDMIEFLDKMANDVANKAALVREEELDLYEITEDYSKEINDSLKNSDLNKAQKIFEEVKDRYLQAPDTSANKKRWYMILEEVYEKIKDYEGNEEGKKNLFETIRDYEQKGLFSKPELFVKDASSAIGLIISSISMKDKQLDNITSQSVLTSKELTDAIRIYREMKELIRRIPNSNLEAKAKASERALSWYYTIRKLKQDLTHPEEKNALAAKEEAMKNIEGRLAEVRNIKAEIITIHARISENLKNKSLMSAVKDYKDLKRLCEEFPVELTEEKTALLAEALSIYDSINKLRRELDGKNSAEEAERIEEDEKKEHREYKRQEISDKLTLVKQALAARDSAKAGKEYNELRAMFSNYPDDSLEEKKKLFDSVVAAHKDIVLLENDARRKSPEPIADSIKAIRERMEDVSSLIGKGKADEASSIILEVKHKLEMLPKEAFDEKYSLIKEVEELEHNILFAKNIQKMDNLKEQTNELIK